MNYQALREELILDEGIRLHPYKDTVGKVTIGVGRNLDDVGISKDEAMMLLDNDIGAVLEGLDRLLPWWRGLSDVRQHVLLNMCFNMGLARLMGFKAALQAMEHGLWDLAADQMRYRDATKTEETPWYKEVGARAIRLVSLMRNGK